MRHTGPRHYLVAAFAFLGATFVCQGAWSQGSTASCTGSNVTVQRGDTLSRLADRCDVSEGSILAANPNIDGSMDLETGQTLRLSREGASGQGIGSSLNDFANEAHEALGRVANRVGASVQDLLDKNPDLRARLDNLGRKIGIEGTTKATLAVTPSTAAPGSTVTVSGVGWPNETSVTIGGGVPGTAFETLQTIRISSSGTFEVHLKVPSWAGENNQFIFSAKAEDGARARSQRLQVTH